MHKIVRKDLWGKKNEIVNLYLDRKQSLSSIARAYKASNNLIKDILQISDVNLRSFSEACSLKGVAGTAIKRKDIWKDKERINQLYWDEKLSTIVIAKMYRCGWSTIARLLRRDAVQLRTIREANLIQKGGRTKTSKGYILVKMYDHPNADRLDYVYEHRIVMEKRLGRYLLKSEKVHHINGIRDDNRDENLKLVSPAEHQIYNDICSKCELRKEVRLLRWQMKELQRQLQGILL